MSDSYKASRFFCVIGLGRPEANSAFSNFGPGLHPRLDIAGLFYRSPLPGTTAMLKTAGNP